MAMVDRKLRVFVSYSRKDIEFADRLVAALEARGLEVLIDRRDLPLLEEWKRELLGFIERADSVVFLVSHNAVASDWCDWEVAQVARLGKRLAPVVIANVDELSVSADISKINYVFFTPPQDFETQCDALVTALMTDTGWIKDHTRLGGLALRWQSMGQPNSQLLRSRDIEAGETWLAERPANAPKPTDLHISYIRQSRRAATRGLRLWIGGALAVMAVTLVLAVLAYTQMKTAKEQEKLAVEQKNSAQRSESRYLADVAQGLIRTGKGTTAMLVALEAVPDRHGGPQNADRPIVEKAVRALDAGWRAPGRKLAVVDIAPGEIMELEFIGNDEGLLGRERLGNLVYWDLVKTGQVTMIPNIRRIPSIPSGYNEEEMQVSDNKAYFVSFQKTTPRDGLGVVEKVEHANIWSAKPLKLLGSVEFAAETPLTFSPDSKSLMKVLDDDGQLVDVPALDVRTGFKNFGSGLVGFRFSMDGRRLASWHSDYSVRLWDVGTGKILNSWPAHSDNILFANFSADAKALFTASSDKSLKIWDVQNGRLIRALRHGGKWMEGAQISSDGSWIITDVDGTPKLWDATTGKDIFDFPFHLEGVRNQEFTPDSTKIFSIMPDYSIQELALPKYEYDTPQVLGVYPGHSNPTDLEGFNHNGSLLLTSGGKETRVWAGGTLIATLVDGDNYMWTAAFSSDDRKVATAAGNSLAIWEMGVGWYYPAPVTSEEASKVGSLDCRQGGAAIEADRPEWSWTKMYGYPLAYNQKNKLLATIADDQVVYILDIASSSVVQSISLRHMVDCAALSNNGNQLIINSSSERIMFFDGEPVNVGTSYVAEIWNISDGVLLASFSTTRGEEEKVYWRARFGEREGSVITRLGDGEPGVWYYKTSLQDLVDDAKRSAPECLSQNERRELSLPPEPPRWCITGPSFEGEQDAGKWQPKQPYHTADWRKWLMARDKGEQTSMPKVVLKSQVIGSK